MTIVFEREALLRPLTYVTGVVERRQTVPVLSYVLVRTNNEVVTLTGTDLETEVVVTTEAESKSAVDMTLPARKLLDICRALPERARLTIQQEGERAIVRAGRSRFTLLTLPTSDFPSIQTTDWEFKFSVSGTGLRRILEEAHFCMAQQDVRYYLNGLLFEMSEQSLRAVGTDGHRMAVSEIQTTTRVPSPRQAIVPRKAVLETIRVLAEAPDTVEIMLSTNHIRMQASGLVFTAKLIDGRYPDYTKVLPAAQSKRLTMDREEFRVALSRAAILSNEKFRGARLVLSSGSLQILAHNPEQEEAQEELSVDYQGEPIEVGFNVNYLIEATSALTSSQVVLGLSDPSSSCLIHDPDSEYPRYVIMPMRL